MTLLSLTSKTALATTWSPGNVHPIPKGDVSATAASPAAVGFGARVPPPSALRALSESDPRATAVRPNVAIASLVEQALVPVLRATHALVGRSQVQKPLSATHALRASTPTTTSAYHAQQAQNAPLGAWSRARARARTPTRAPPRVPRRARDINRTTIAQRKFSAALARRASEGRLIA